MDHRIEHEGVVGTRRYAEFQAVAIHNDTLPLSGRLLRVGLATAETSQHPAGTEHQTEYHQPTQCPENLIAEKMPYQPQAHHGQHDASEIEPEKFLLSIVEYFYYISNRIGQRGGQCRQSLVDAPERKVVADTVRHSAYLRTADPRPPGTRRRKPRPPYSLSKPRPPRSRGRAPYSTQRPAVRWRRPSACTRRRSARAARPCARIRPRPPRLWPHARRRRPLCPQGSASARSRVSAAARRHGGGTGYHAHTAYRDPGIGSETAQQRRSLHFGGKEYDRPAGHMFICLLPPPTRRPSRAAACRL